MKKKYIITITCLMILFCISLCSCVPPIIPVSWEISKRFYNTKEDRALLDAITEHDLEGVKEAIANGAGEESVTFAVVPWSKIKMSPVLFSIGIFPEAAEYMLQQGRDPNVSYIQDYTMLMCLAGADKTYKDKFLGGISSNEEKPVKIWYKNDVLGKQFQPSASLLLQYGADINKTTKKGETALYFAVLSDNLSMAKYCIDNGANITEKTMLLLEEKIKEGYNQYVFANYLFSKYIESGENFQKNKILQAAVLGDTKTFEELLQKEKIEKAYKVPVLFFCAAFGNAEVLQQLSERGYNLQELNEQEYSLNDVAAAHGNMETLNFLYGQGIKLHNIDLIESTYGFSMMFRQAVEQRNYPLTKEFLEQGFNPNMEDSNGKFPISIAIENNDLEMVKLLLDYGARVDDMDINAYTPMELAQQQPDQSIYNYLKQWAGQNAS